MLPGDYVSRNKRVRFALRFILIVGYAFLAYALYFVLSTVAAQGLEGDSVETTLGLFMLLFFVLFVIGVILATAFSYHDKSFRKNIVKPTVENAVPGLTYTPNTSQISNKELKERRIIPGFNAYNFFNNAGQVLKYSDEELSYTAYYMMIPTEEVNKKPKLRQFNPSAFEGWIVVATPSSTIDGTVIVAPASNLRTREMTPNLPRISLEHTTLSQYYNVFSDNELLVRYVLTPTEIDALIKAHRDYPRLRFAYHRDLFTLGLYEKEDPFKVGLWQAVDYDRECARIEMEAKKLHDDTVAIIRELTN